MPLLECFLGANKIIDLPVHFNDLFHFLFLGFCLLVDFDLLENGLLTLFVCSVSLLPGNFRYRIRVFIVYKKRVDL